MINLINFFSNDEKSGVAHKNHQRKKLIISYLDETEEATIAEISIALNVSVPTITSLITELIEDGLIKDYGKIDSTAGRPANLYGLVAESCFFIGVDVKQNYINIGLLDFKKNLAHVNMHIPFNLENNAGCLDCLIKMLKDFIDAGPINKNQILSICINLSGRINTQLGYSYSYFNFSEEPLSSIIEREIGIRTFLENDSRAMAYGEFHRGIVKNEKNVLFINLDWGIGLGIMIEGKVYYGKSGFSGEFGHIPLFDNEIICHCGKKGCLETEASGRALMRLFKERISNGSSSVIISSTDNLNTLDLAALIEAAKQEDFLTIDILSRIGEKLGRGLAVLINLFNAEMVVLGGILVTTGDYLILPIKSAINKYSLSLVHNDTKLCVSQLGEKAGIIGGSLIARNKLLSGL